MSKSYSELIRLKTFEERFDYLDLKGIVGVETYGHLRYLNQKFYTSEEWRLCRRRIIVRDGGFDLGIEDRLIPDGLKMIVHHINPISAENILNADPICFDPENLITVSDLTHKAIHYGDIDILPSLPMERKPGDTKLW